MRRATPSPTGQTPRASTATSRERTLQALMAVVDDLSVELEEAGLLGSTLAHVIAALDLSGGITYLLGLDGELAVAAVQGTEDAEEHRALARFTLDRGEPVVSEQADGGWWAATALQARRGALGVLLLHEAGRGAAAPDLDLLTAIGKQIGNGLDNVRLYGELLAGADRVHRLSRITAHLSAGQEVAAVLPGFAGELQGLQRFDRVACGLLNESGDYIEVTGHPEGTSWGLGQVMPVVGSGPGFAVLQGKPFIQRDLVHDHRFIEDMRLLEEGLRSYILLPLSARGRAIGVLCLGASAEGTYDDGTLARLQPLADQVALAFENLRLFQKAKEQSITDEITPLYNFRFFHQILEREIKLVDRYGSSVSMVFLDLDRFKPINDTYGHLRGSRTLREVGFVIRAAVRETDYPVRYGGDEFVVVLPHTEKDAAVAIAEKLRELIEDHTFLQEEGINARLGASVGVATYPSEARSKEELIRLSDRRMYDEKQARKAGR